MTADASGIIIDTGREIREFEGEEDDKRRQLIKQRMQEIEDKHDAEEDDEGLFGDEDEMPQVVEEDQQVE